MDVAFGPLPMDMLRMRIYGCVIGKGLNKSTPSAVVQQKSINLLIKDIMSRDCYVTKDLVYMGQLLALVTRNVWKINVMNMVQITHCGLDSAWISFWP